MYIGFEESVESTISLHFTQHLRVKWSGSRAASGQKGTRVSLQQIHVDLSHSCLSHHWYSVWIWTLEIELSPFKDFSGWNCRHAEWRVHERTEFSLNRTKSVWVHAPFNASPNAINFDESTKHTHRSNEREGCPNENEYRIQLQYACDLRSYAAEFSGHCYICVQKSVFFIVHIAIAAIIMSHSRNHWAF